MSWTASKKCLVIAHRGNTKAGVENTLPAIESALKLGVDGVEVDLQLTRDGEVVLFHDDDFQRLAGRPEHLKDLNLVEVKKISLNGSTVPTLAELLDLVRDKALLNLEIKVSHYFSGELEQKTIRLLRDFGLSESVLLSSFYPQALWRLKKIAPELFRGYLFEKHPGLHRWVWPCIDPLSINAPLQHTSEFFVRSQHTVGRRFFVWTVNDEADMKRCLEWGVDGMITDEPQKLLKKNSPSP